MQKSSGRALIFRSIVGHHSISARRRHFRHNMSRIKQLLQLKKLGLSNRQIAKDLKISRDKTNEYVRMAELDSLDIDALLRLDDPVLEKRFHPGNPAYSDSRMGTFLELLPDFVEQLSHKHVTRQLVWEEYKRTHPDGYEKSQFYFHLAQNLKARKTPTSVLQHDPGKELFVDFAGDTLGYAYTHWQRHWSSMAVCRE